MTLHVRQLAWLHAAFKDEGAEEAVSRLERFADEGVDPELPPNPAPHYVDWLLELGPVEAAGVGRAPVSWRELDAWAGRTTTFVQPWEARLLKRLSQAYLGSLVAGEKADCPPPWSDIPDEDLRDLVDRKLDLFFGK